MFSDGNPGKPGPEQYGKPAVVSQMLLGWRSMDTSRAEKLTAAQLLERVEYLEVAGGWGLLAELMKRFAKDHNV